MFHEGLWKDVTNKYFDESYKPHILFKKDLQSFFCFASIISETRQERRTEQEYHTDE